jgi:putative mRNA 3-end processing factor
MTAMVLNSTSAGLYCPAGDFYIDPWRPVPRAVITHGHADHARAGHGAYLTSPAGRGILQVRLGDSAPIQALPFLQPLKIGAATVSLHPAGHVLGSAQVRVEVGGEVWVVSGDYKLSPDGISEAWEPVPCHTFVTESTFGLPVYRWPPQSEVFAEMARWWENNQEAGQTSVVYAYSLGKAQRLLAGLEPDQGPIAVHPAVASFLPAYRAAGVSFPEAWEWGPETAARVRGRGLVIAPPAVADSAWERALGSTAKAFASGWMRVRGIRRRRNLQAGFALSDHADWPGLLRAIELTGARRVGVTHGYVEVLTRYLTERGYDAFPVATQFRGDDAPDVAEASS